MTPQGFKQRVTWCHPFEAVLLSRLAICGKTRVSVGQGLELPVWSGFVAPQDLRRGRGIIGVRKRGNGLQSEGDVRSHLADEASKGLWDDSALLRAGTLFDEHVQVERLDRQTLKSILTNG